MTKPAYGITDVEGDRVSLLTRRRAGARDVRAPVTARYAGSSEKTRRRALALLFEMRVRSQRGNGCDQVVCWLKLHAFLHETAASAGLHTLEITVVLRANSHGLNESV